MRPCNDSVRHNSRLWNSDMVIFNRFGQEMCYYCQNDNKWNSHNRLRFEFLRIKAHGQNSTDSCCVFLVSLNRSRNLTVEENVYRRENTFLCVLPLTQFKLILCLLTSSRQSQKYHSDMRTYLTCLHWGKTPIWRKIKPGKNFLYVS